MARRRKMKRSQKASDDETESQRPSKQFKKRNSSSTEISTKNISSYSKEEHDNSGDSDICNLGETSGTAADDTHYESFSSFLKAFSYYHVENDNEHRKSNDASQNASNGCENSMMDSTRRKSQGQVSHPTSSHENVFDEDSESKIRILSVPSKLCHVVLLHHPASIALHGYVKVTVWFGSVHVFGYNVKEGESISVFSTEGTGLKKVVSARPKHRLDTETLKKDLVRLTSHANTELETFLDDIGPSSVVVCVKKLLLPPPLQFLQLYFPAALQTRWVRSETSEKEKNLELCSAEEDYVIDVDGDFNILSKQVNAVITNPAPSDDADFGPRILVRGGKNMGKSTLIRYLMNSALNKVDAVYFLDTDPGQTEYTPPGVVSLLRVTKPLFGPPFAHQKKPLKMVFTGSVTPGTSPTLYGQCVFELMKLFNAHFKKETLFVNTMGWVQGVGELCLQSVQSAVKPTIEIELIAPDPNLSLTKEVDENGVTIFKVPSKAPPRKSGAPSYSPVLRRDLNITAYLGQCQKSYMPVSLINSFHPVCVSWDKIALYVMDKKVPAHRLVEAMHCSFVALCKVNLSYVLKSDNPDFPMTLTDEPICECLGFGLVRASDEINHLFYIVTPLNLDQLKNVNALVKGNIMIPNEIFIKQSIENVPLPFTNHSEVAKTPGLKSVPKRAFRNTLTPKKTP